MWQIKSSWGIQMNTVHPVGRRACWLIFKQISKMLKMILFNALILVFSSKSGKQSKHICKNVYIFPENCLYSAAIVGCVALKCVLVKSLICTLFLNLHWLSAFFRSAHIQTLSPCANILGTDESNAARGDICTFLISLSHILHR